MMLLQGSCLVPFVELGVYKTSSIYASWWGPCGRPHGILGGRRYNRVNVKELEASLSPDPLVPLLL